MVAGMGPTAGELRTISLFQGFADGELAAVSALCERVTVDPAHPLFDVGEHATELYVLTSGEVVLDAPNDDRFRLHPPALIGELGALTGLPRSTCATVGAGSTVWKLAADRLQAYFASHHELGIRFLANLLSVVADKVHRDQKRMADMRGNLMRTQKELKRMRELVLDSTETPLSQPLHDTLDKLITHNRRVNYRVEPPPALAATLRFDAGTAEVIDISRTHVSARAEGTKPPAVGSWITGVLGLAGTDIPISGRVHRVQGERLTLELALLIDEYAAVLAGYLTRAPPLAVLV